MYSSVHIEATRFGGLKMREEQIPGKTSFARQCGNCFTLQSIKQYVVPIDESIACLRPIRNLAAHRPKR